MSSDLSDNKSVARSFPSTSPLRAHFAPQLVNFIPFRFILSPFGLCYPYRSQLASEMSEKSEMSENVEKWLHTTRQLSTPVGA